MKLNIENGLRNAKGRQRAWMISELFRLLKELRTAVRTGDTATANQFFDIIVFDEPETVVPPVETRPCGWAADTQEALKYR